MRPAVAAAFVAAAVATTGSTAYFAFESGRSGTLAFWTLAAAPSVLLAVVGLAWAKHEELLGDWLVPKSGDFTLGVAGAAAFFGGAWAGVRVVAPPGSTREIWLASLYGQIGDPRGLQAHAPAVAATIAVAAFSEEVLWRGAVTRLVAERAGSRWAWIWAAGLYALAYVPTAWSLRASDGAGGGLNPALPLVALAGGLLWGAMARVLGRLTPGILAHALFDWAVLMMFPLWGMHA